jgi:hypothetical protein
MLAGICLTLAVGGGWLLYDSITTLAFELRTGAPVVHVSVGDLAMLLLLPIIAGFGLLGLRALIRPAPVSTRPAEWLIVAALVILPLALFAPPIVGW